MSNNNRFHAPFLGIDSDALNNIFNSVKDRKRIVFRERNQGEEIGNKVFIYETPTAIYVEYRDHVCELVKGKVSRKTKTFRWQLDKDNMYISKTTPLNASAQFGKVYHIEDIEDLYGIKPKDIVTEKPLLYANSVYRGKPYVAYEYDMSAAYLQMLKLPIPNQYTLRKHAKLGKGQCGFVEWNGELEYTEVEGRYCDYVFDLMPSPFIKKVEALENKIAKEQDKNKKTDLKNIYRLVVGCWRNKNPFIRGCIIGRCNTLVKSLIDKDTIYANTDSIVSTKPRPDIMESGFIWKLKHNGELFKLSKRTKFDYQWNLETPTQRGLVKRYVEYYNQTHEEPWDILKNTIPCDLETLYILDREELQIKENTKWLKM